MPKPAGQVAPRDVAKMLRADGWMLKKRGPGDHVQYAHPTRPGKVTLDMGAGTIPTGTLRSIYRQAGWDW
jgi:predicted RNA binding protein YcfA (HicA-like mRNA interferase family)